MPPELLAQINAIAPVLVVTDLALTHVLVARLVQLGASLGADLESPEVVAARAAYEARLAEFQEVAAEKANLTNLFANFDTSLIYVGGPKDVSELQWLATLGLNFANANSEMATEFWEELSAEQALLYPADVIFSDVYSVLLTAEDLAAEPLNAPFTGHLTLDTGPSSPTKPICLLPADCCLLPHALDWPIVTGEGCRF